MTTAVQLIEQCLIRAKQTSDVVMAVIMAMIIGAMIVPMPSWLLDVGIAMNLAAALSLLVAALYAKDALAVASFPTLLLVTTLFRLAMNVSSTRLALSEGHAGDIIQAFGEFVVNGDYVVGAVVFAILTLVQFLVVAKGAERVAEVSARFTLDAMPGKQMSIDADLRAGAINQDQARARRRSLERESQLFGSMDGAMKFVKGDVIAGLIITLINLIGGTTIGVLQGGMTMGEAASTYALISIGDGLVSQIPSLCIAIAAGLIVTRVSSESDESSLGADIGSQFFGRFKALFVVAGLCLALAVIPGMPHVTFVVIASLFATAGFGLMRMEQRASSGQTQGHEAGRPIAKHAAQPSAPPAQILDQTPAVAPLMLDLASDLTWLTEETQSQFVHGHLNTLRQDLFMELGVQLPAIRVRTGAPLPSGSWLLRVDEIPAARGQHEIGRWFAAAAPEELKMLGLDATPAPDTMSGKALCIVREEDREIVSSAGYSVRSIEELVCEHLSRALRKRCAHFLGVQEVQTALVALEAKSPALVKEALNKVPLPLLTDVLRKLLNEQVGIRNLRSILGALVAPSTEGDATQLAEHCRQALSRQLSHQYAPSGPLLAYLVDPSVEERLRHIGVGTALDPKDVSAILENARRLAKNGSAVLLSSPDVRRQLRRIIEGVLPDVAVLGFGDLGPEIQIRPLGRLAINA
jgi:type III secretion protein V